MSENEKKTTPGEEISEEQLNDVSGGYATVNDPRKTSFCWFKAEGEMREDGRTRCSAECKGNFALDSAKYKPVGVYDKGEWLLCRCWGTGYCIDKWHLPCGYNNRWQSNNWE